MHCFKIRYPAVETLEEIEKVSLNLFGTVNLIKLKEACQLTNINMGNEINRCKYVSEFVKMWIGKTNVKHRKQWMLENRL